MADLAGLALRGGGRHFLRLAHGSYGRQKWRRNRQWLISLFRGRAGGGAIEMTVTGMLTLGGRISANLPGVGQESGGGSGGSILLSAGELTGGGVITANGGSAQLPLGGGGGGGRIAVSANTNLFTGGMSAHGGAGFVAGGAGAIYVNWRQSSSKYAQIVLDNGGLRGAPESLVGSWRFGPCHQRRSGGDSPRRRAEPAQFADWVQQLSDSDQRRSGAMGHERQCHDPGGRRNIVDGVANGSGAPAPLGAGATGTDIINGQMVGGGGGYGGDGGSGAGGAAGGGSYGAILQPVSLGSPGGAGAAVIGVGGGGGGAVELSVTGVLQLDGTISANGNGTNGNAGGGSGGSILLTAGGFSGAGVARANGGAGHLPRGGGGGGGRIAVYYGTNQFSGGLSAYGAPGFVGGGAGTVYTASAKPNGNNGPGQVMVDNGGLTGANTRSPRPRPLA